MEASKILVISMETKSKIRKEILALRKDIPENEKAKSKVLISEKIIGHQWYYSADTILLYKSYGSELNTDFIAEDAFKKGKKVYYPKVCGDVMEFYQVSSLDMLKSGYKGILEPEETKLFCYKELSGENVLMIMPGVAFDVYRNRIGYGKGYYDKYLSDKPSIRTIAVGYVCQIVEKIEANETDIRPMQIICL